ncbi:hypothetical protein PBAL39_15034 [Pedobacter sp. BAL39]|uniref:hypothetical protein n=1 Tax=Pedobacter sp. BAL39 TaxID=391596 RepID=UPI00015599B6|nr:hypothetical protein [Pedobacter sp. BAL39]EDM37750.1 hypothetical protein PBAL39_15034 [Pedobacter sp. BAL39]
MKTINSYAKLPALFMLVILMLTSCNKEKLDSERALQVVVNGYNGGVNTLEMTIDTTGFGAGISNGKYLLNPSSIIGTSIAYSFFGEKQRMLTLSEVESKKVVFSKPIPNTGTKAFFNFIYVDGKELEINPPTADASTNKLGFYVQYADSDMPFDIFLYRMNNVTGQEYRYYLAKNVKAKGWIYIDYIAPADFGDKSSLGISSIFFTKTGTVDQWAFQDNEAMSKISASSMSFPLSGETGLVLPFFFAHQQGLLNRSRLFFYPDRQW